jgi:hypothetical protein
LEKTFHQKESAFEEEKQKLHRFIIHLESKLREVELERSSITYDPEKRKVSLAREGLLSANPLSEFSDDNSKKVQENFPSRVTRESSPSSESNPTNGWEPNRAKYLEKLTKSRSEYQQHLESQNVDDRNFQRKVEEKRTRPISPYKHRVSDSFKENSSEFPTSDNIACPNCRREKSQGEVIVLQNCSHKICQDCFGKYLGIWLKMPSAVQVKYLLESR